MSAHDYRINAEVRRYLVTRWVDVNALHLGATNGVVYVMGRLDTTLEDPTRRLDEEQHRTASDRILHLALTIDRDLRRIRDVRDVVFKLENAFKRGGRWRAMDGSRIAQTRGRGVVSVQGQDGAGTGREAAPRTWNIAPEDRSDGADPETDA